jgi:hypothetical protein
MASIEKLREAWQRQLTAAQDKLGPRTALTGIAISWHLNRQTGEAFPSIKTLAALTSMSRSTVKRSVAKLIAAGHMTRTQSRPNRPNHYAPVVNRGSTAMNRSTVMTPQGFKALDLQGSTAVSPEPLNQPPIEPGKADFLDGKGRKRFLEAGTPQSEAWNRDRRTREGRGYPEKDFKIDGRIKRGWYFPADWPPQ